MNIKMMLAQEAANKYDDMEDAECYYEMLLGYYTRRAVMCYKKLYIYFNGDLERTGRSVVPEEKCIEVLGLDSFEGARIIAMMCELNITERQNGGIVI
mgnify:CR=1 FL=1|jgi:hypothetical protein|nr:MAG TPA: hypothetical protein [Caudoviricetes sp.]